MKRVRKPARTKQEVAHSVAEVLVFKVEGVRVYIDVGETGMHRIRVGNET